MRPAVDGAHERNRTADLLLTMQMLYRLSYVGGDAARRTARRVRRPASPESASLFGARKYPYQGKNPRPAFSPTSRRSSVNYEPSTVIEAETTVNKKFAADFEVRGEAPRYWIFASFAAAGTLPERRPHGSIHRKAAVGSITRQVSRNATVGRCGKMWMEGSGREKSGAGNGIRTRDPQLGRLTL